MIQIFNMKFRSLCLFALLSLLCALTSCESRKDVFYPLDSGPVVLFSTDAVTWSQDISVALRSGGDCVVHYRLKGEYPYSLSEALTLDEYLWSVGDSTAKDSKTEDVRISFNGKDSTFTVSSLRPLRTWTKAETYKRLTFCLTSEDVYKKSSSALTHISVSSYRGLRASVDSLVFDPSETRVRLWASSPGNSFSDRAVAFEYLFDGEIMYDADGWECADFSSWNANPGQAARGGYYITATPLTSVRHVFQCAGVHTLAVRCKSSAGMWGPWSRYRVDVDSRTWGAE